MRHTILITLLLIPCAVAFPQLRSFAIHQRGLLHETEYNTGEIGRAYDNGGSGGLIGTPSFEWPAIGSPQYSGIYVDQTRTNNAQYNSFGGGFFIAANQEGTRYTIQCGAVTWTVFPFWWRTSTAILFRFSGLRTTLSSLTGV